MLFRSPSDSSPSVPSNPGAPAGPSTPGTTPDDTDSGEESDAPAEPDSDTPSLSVTAVRVDNGTVTPGERVTVTVDVANTGNATGSYAAALAVGGRAPDGSDGDRRANVTVPAGDNRTLTLTTAFDQPGTYDVQVGNSTRSITVEEATEQPQTDPSEESRAETPTGTPPPTPTEPTPVETTPTPTEKPVVTPGPTPPKTHPGNGTAVPSDSTARVTTEQRGDATTTDRTPGMSRLGLASLGVVVATVLGVVIFARYR